MALKPPSALEHKIKTARILICAVVSLPVSEKGYDINNNKNKFKWKA